MILRFTRVACTSSSALLFAEYILWGGHLCARSVAQPYPTLCDLMDYNPPGSPVHGISQARVLEWIPLTSPGNLSNPRIKPSSPALAGRLFTTGPLQKLMVWIHHILFISSPVNEHYLSIASLGQLWIMWPSRFVYTSWCGQLPFFLECYPGVELNEGYNCVLNFIRHCASILQGGCPNIHSHWQGMSIHLSPYSCQRLLASIFKNFSHSSLYVTGFHSQLNLHFP